MKKSQTSLVYLSPEETSVLNGHNLRTNGILLVIQRSGVYWNKMKKAAQVEGSLEHSNTGKEHADLEFGEGLLQNS